MMYAMPVMIFFFAMYSASGVALYWVVSNAYQVGQTYLLNNPFKIIEAREAEQQAIKDLENKNDVHLTKHRKRKTKKEFDRWSNIKESMLKKPFKMV